jgi:hypothetical protein
MQPVREFSNYLSFKMRSRALVEKHKIDEFGKVELDHQE